MNECNRFFNCFTSNIENAADILRYTSYYKRSTSFHKQILICQKILLYTQQVLCAIGLTIETAKRLFIQPTIV